MFGAAPFIERWNNARDNLGKTIDAAYITFRLVEEDIKTKLQSLTNE